jgi:hypothetical protein
MRIAFDLDGTLIACGYVFPAERRHPVITVWGVESLRKGSVELMRFFQRQGEEVWIYTTSFRSTAYIRLLFLLHGVWVDGVINQTVHNRRIKKSQDWPRCSKYPPAFAIDLLIDDQEGVQLEAERYGFRMIRIEPERDDWTETVIAGYRKFKRESERITPE